MRRKTFDAFMTIGGLVLAAVFVGWGLSAGGRQWMLGLAILGAAGIIAVAVYDMRNIQSVADESGDDIFNFHVQIGYGLYVTFIGGAVAVLAVLIGARK